MSSSRVVRIINEWNKILCSHHHFVKFFRVKRGKMKQRQRPLSTELASMLKRIFVWIGSCYYFIIVIVHARLLVSITHECYNLKISFKYKMS